MRRAFTLVEIIVVTVILMILAALLFPVFARAKENNKLSTCMAQLKQDAIGMQLYRVDNDDLGYRHVMQGNKYPWNWYEGLASYIKDGRLVWCVEPGNWDGPIVEHSFYKWQHYTDTPVGSSGPDVWSSWDASPGRVVWFCTNHNRGEEPHPIGLRKGLVTFAREDGSTGKVDSSRIVAWIYSAERKEWRLPPAPSDWTRYLTYNRFPNEPWPPVPEL